MPAPGHAQKTLERAANTYADLYDQAHGGIPIRQRICLRCQRPINGYGFYTLYGYIWVVAPGPTRDGSVYEIKVHGCGESVHHRCTPGQAERREPVHDPAALEGVVRPSRVAKHIAPGIDLNHNGRYAAQWEKHRLGTHGSIKEAQAAIDRYRKQLEKSV